MWLLLYYCVSRMWILLKVCSFRIFMKNFLPHSSQTLVLRHDSLYWSIQLFSSTIWSWLIPTTLNLATIVFYTIIRAQFEKANTIHSGTYLPDGGYTLESVFSSITPKTHLLISKIKLLFCNKNLNEIKLNKMWRQKKILVAKCRAGKLFLCAYHLLRRYKQLLDSSV